MINHCFEVFYFHFMKFLIFEEHRFNSLILLHLFFFLSLSLSLKKILGLGLILGSVGLNQSIQHLIVWVLNTNPKVKISWVGNMSSAMNMQCSNNQDRIEASNAEQILKSTHAHFMITGGQNSILEISHIVCPQVRQTWWAMVRLISCESQVWALFMPHSKKFAFK